MYVVYFEVFHNLLNVGAGSRLAFFIVD